MTSLTQSQANCQPSDAWRIGYEDARNGGSEYDGYTCFIGPNLTEYREGFSAGRIINQCLSGVPMPPTVAGRLQARVLAEVRRLAGGSEAKPKTEVELMDADLEDLRQSRTQPILRYTDEMMAEIENERF